jgi:hypothetical protein
MLSDSSKRKKLARTKKKLIICLFYEMNQLFGIIYSSKLEGDDLDCSSLNGDHKPITAMASFLSQVRFFVLAS